MIFFLDPQTSLYNCHVCKSNYNHSGNFKQHLLKHERESGSISATLVAQAGQNPHLTSVLQSAMTDRVDKCDREFEEKKNQYRKYIELSQYHVSCINTVKVICALNLTLN